jgi:hypothetical protein
MGEPRMKYIGLTGPSDLNYSCQPAEGRTVENPIAILLILSPLIIRAR